MKGQYTILPGRGLRSTKSCIHRQEIVEKKSMRNWVQFKNKQKYRDGNVARMQRNDQSKSEKMKYYFSGSNKSPFLYAVLALFLPTAVWRLAIFF